MTSAMRILLFLFIFGFISTTAYAQVRVTVHDVQDNEPLTGATLLHKQSGKYFFTGDNGRAEIDKGLTGQLHVTFIGYEAKTVHLPANKQTLTVGMEPDVHVLRNVEVIGYQNTRNLIETAGTYGVVESNQIEAYGDESLVNAVNTVPGIRMEQRSPGSYRLSMRGNLLRAPYGVRNVKVYWNEIPFTDPTGNTPINFLHNSNIQRLELIKGPSGSIYGAGMGGVVLMKSRMQQEEGISGGAGYTFGSFGLQNFDGHVSHRGVEHQMDIRYSNQSKDGYRAHTDMERETVQLLGQWFGSDRHTISYNAFYSDLYYQFPGGLTAEQMEADPTQARQASVDQDALLDQQNFYMGISHEYFIDDNTTHVTSLYYNNGVKENPFITNHETEKLTGYGARTKFSHSAKLAGSPLQLMAGGEFQYGNFHADNHGNVNGYADTLRFEDASRVHTGFLFAQADWEIQSWIITAATSVNYLKFDINRLRDVALDSSYRLVRNFDPEVSPRVSVLHKINKQVTAHGSVSFGFSPPTQDELRTSDGDINETLEAEKGINYELGLRGNFFDNKISVDATGFFMRQYETIVSQTLQGGNATFRNAGSTRQMGVEAMLGWLVFNTPGALFEQLRFRTSLTYHDFIFDEYEKASGQENQDFSGNQLTGTAPFISVNTIDLSLGNGLYCFFSHNFTDEIPLNDSNTVYSRSYHLVNAKLGWEGINILGAGLEVFVGSNNLLNEQYSLGNDLNAFGNRYFNPSPTRNYYGGINIKF